MLRGGDIKNGTLSDDLLLISSDKNIEFKRTILRDNDVVIALVGYPGEAAVVPPRLSGANISRAVGLLRPQPTLSPSFLACYLNSPQGRREFLKPSAGSAQLVVNLGALNQLRFPLPSPTEQAAIATALGDADALIESLERLVAKKRDIKQGAMQELLTGKRRLPGFTGKWETKRLGEIGDISGSGVDKKCRPNEIPVRLVNYMDAARRDFIYNQDLNHWVTAPPAQARRCAVQKGDIFFTPSSETREDIGLAAVAMEDIPDATYSYHIVRLRLWADWDLRYRTYAFKTRGFLSQTETYCDGCGTRYVLSQAKFRKLTISVPADKDEQTAIAAVLADMDAELAALGAKLAKARAIKQGMMQELLTGRIRLK